MLIGLLSDTHEHLPRIAQAVARFNAAGVDIVLHAGDLVSPFTAQEFQKLRCPFIAVFGNNDGERAGWRKRVQGWGEVHEGPYERVFEGKTLLLMHEPDRLEEIARNQRYDVIVYGHTHEREEHVTGKTLIVNPGECGGWLTGRSTIALLELPSKKITFIDLK